MSRRQNKISFPLKEEGSDCHRVIIRIDPADIAYFVMVVEAYEALGIPRTVNQSEGIVEILASPDYKEDVRDLLDALKREIKMEVIRA